jgi:hypothetical protein
VRVPNDKDARLVEYRSLGVTFDQIATLEGYKSRQAAQQAWARAVKKFPSPEVETVRAEADAVDDYLRRKMNEIVEKPPYVHSATGVLTPDPETCTCGRRLAKYMSDHDPDCQVEPVRDVQRVIAAAEVIRKLSKEKVILHGAAQKQMLSEDEALAQMNKFLAALPPRDSPAWAYAAEVIATQEEQLAVEAAVVAEMEDVPTRYVADRQPVQPPGRDGGAGRV